jgi:hypothetical protein
MPARHLAVKLPSAVTAAGSEAPPGISVEVSLSLEADGGSAACVGETVTVLARIKGTAGFAGRAISVGPGRALLGHGALELVNASALVKTESVGPEGSFEALLRLRAACREGGALRLCGGDEVVRVCVDEEPVAQVRSGSGLIDTIVMG